MSEAGTNETGSERSCAIANSAARAIPTPATHAATPAGFIPTRIPVQRPRRQSQSPVSAPTAGAKMSPVKQKIRFRRPMAEVAISPNAAAPPSHVERRQAQTRPVGRQDTAVGIRGVDRWRERRQAEEDQDRACRNSADSMEDRPAKREIRGQLDAGDARNPLGPQPCGRARDDQQRQKGSERARQDDSSKPPNRDVA